MSPLVDTLFYLSAIGAAFFAWLSWAKKYEARGKVTRWGRLAPALIALTALTALVSKTLEDRIAAQDRATGVEAARSQRAEQKAQFDTQLAHLRNLNLQMRRTNAANEVLLASTARSLATQRLLLTNAQRSILLTANVGLQERRNAGRLLRSLWEGANRIDGSRVELEADAYCETAEGERLPLSFAGGRAQIEVRTEEMLRQDAESERAFYRRQRDRRMSPQTDEIQLGDEIGPLPSLVPALESFSYETALHFVSSNWSVGITKFRNFFMLPDYISSPDSWRNGRVRIWIDSPLLPLLQNLGLQAYETTGETGTPGRHLLPCYISVRVSANGRTLAYGDARAEVWLDERRALHVQVSAGPFPVQNGELPAYDGGETP